MDTAVQSMAGSRTLQFYQDVHNRLYETVTNINKDKQKLSLMQSYDGQIETRKTNNGVRVSTRYQPHQRPPTT